MSDHVWRVMGMYHPLNPNDDAFADVFTSLIRTPDLHPHSLAQAISENYAEGDPETDPQAVRYELTSIKYEGPLA